MKTRLDPKIIREGDRVRVVVPKICVRVGYPKQVSDYLEAARAKYAKLLREDMKDHLVEKALHQIAYGMAKKDGFGGPERTLHLKDEPGIAGKEFTVWGIRTVQTGTYYPPNSWQGWTDSGYDYDYEPGGLADQKSHRLATGCGWLQFTTDMMEIPVAHLEKLDVDKA